MESGPVPETPPLPKTVQPSLVPGLADNTPFPEVELSDWSERLVRLPATAVKASLVAFDRSVLW